MNETQLKMLNGYSVCQNTSAFDNRIQGELGLLMIISSLCAKTGICTASNSFLAELFETTEVTISRKIKKLHDAGYINMEYITKGSVKTIRSIKMIFTINKNVNRTINKNVNRTINKNVKLNNTSNNNTSNNIKLHSPSSKNSQQLTLKRTIPKTSNLENKESIKKELTTKQKNNLRSKAFLPQAIKIKQILQEKKNIEITPNQLTAWTNSIRLLCDKNKISVERMDTVLSWYEKHWDDDYVPVIESGESFRTKFVKLEAAISRNKPKQKTGSFRTGVNIDMKNVKSKKFNNKTGIYET